MKLNMNMVKLLMTMLTVFAAASACADTITYSYVGPKFLSIPYSDPYAPPPDNITGSFTVSGLPANYTGNLSFTLVGGTPAYTFGGTTILASDFIQSFQFTAGSDSWSSANGQLLSILSQNQFNLNNFSFVNGLPTQWFVTGNNNTWSSTFWTQAVLNPPQPIALDSVRDIINNAGFASLSSYPTPYVPITGKWTETVVSSVPEPESYAMLLAGLGLIGFIARRKTQRA